MATEMVSLGIPSLAEVANLPFAGRHQSFGFVRKIDAGLVAVAHHLGVLRDAIDTQPIADVIEERVAGMHQALVQPHRSMLTPALEEAAVEGGRRPGS